jgi:hypothetical protein
MHRTRSWPLLRARTIELALAAKLQLGALPRLALPVEQAAERFAALMRPAEVLQTALRYDQEAIAAGVTTSGRAGPPATRQAPPSLRSGVRLDMMWPDIPISLAAGGGAKATAALAASHEVPAYVE